LINSIIVMAIAAITDSPIYAKLLTPKTLRTSLRERVLAGSPAFVGMVVDGASIMKEGRSRYLGSFADRVEAHAVYLKAKAELHSFQPVQRKAGR
jgi:hypothetical protein